MNACESVRNALVLYAEGALGESEAGQVREHLRQCPDCRRESRAIEDVIRSLSDPELFRPEEDLAWQLLPARLAARAQAPPAARWLPLHFSSRAWGLTMAALLLVMCGSIHWIQRRAAQPAATQAEAAGNREFLARIQALQARGAAVQYLEECRDFLLDLMRSRENCADGGIELSFEVDRARRLLARRRMLAAELDSPEVIPARAVCEEIDHFLVGVSTSETCVRPDEIRRMEHYIERERLLLRIRLLQAELSGE